MARRLPKAKRGLAEVILGEMVRRHSTAAVLFHHAVAERLGLGPTDHKCLDLVRDRGPLTGSDLAVITGLTSGAITGVVTRLETAGYLRREPHPDDGRKYALHPEQKRVRSIGEVFEPIRRDLADLLDRFDIRQLTAIAEFLGQSTTFLYRHVALLRAQGLAREVPARRPEAATAHRRRGGR